MKGFLNGYGGSGSISSPSFSYFDRWDHQVAMGLWQGGADPTIGIITNINQINGTVVNSMVDPGFIPIYPPSSIPLNIWNSN